MKIGDTYVWCPAGTVVQHLWIIISDPAQHGGKCVVINLTESAHAAHSFTLKPGQHRYIYKDSDVNFGDAFLTTDTELKLEVSNGAAVPHDPMDAAIVGRIIKLAHKHPAFAPFLRKYLA